MFDVTLGSCEEELSHFPEKSVDCVIVDPPYCTLGHKWDTPLKWDLICKELKRICSPKSAILIFSDYKSIFSIHQNIVSAGLKYKYFLIWDKVCTMNNSQNARTMPINSYEYVLVFSLDGSSINYYSDGDKFQEDVLLKYAVLGKNRTSYDIKEALEKTKRGEAVDHLFFSSRDNNYDGRGFAIHLAQKNAINLVQAGEAFCEEDGLRRRVTHLKNNPKMLLTIPNKDIGKEKLHPTQKPIELMKKLVTLYSKPGDLILDFCMGSGSTGVAALELERNFIGIERDDTFFNIAKERINNAQNKQTSRLFDCRSSKTK